MKIIRYKYKGNSRYEIETDQDKYIIYEDIIIKNNLLSKDNIEDKEFNNILKENEFYDCYYAALKYINIKLRSKFEIIKYLEKKEYSTNDINNVIERLINEGYINENVYAKAYVYDAINLGNDGPLKIKKDLINNGISSDVVLDSILVFDKDLIFEKLNKIISKEIKLNKNKSKRMLYEKIVNNLVNKGYSKEDIKEVFDSYEIDDEKIEKQEYDKLYNKLKNKYEGKELEFKIKQKMYQKGFRNF